LITRDRASCPSLVFDDGSFIPYLDYIQAAPSLPLSSIGAELFYFLLHLAVGLPLWGGVIVDVAMGMGAFLSLNWVILS